MAQQHLDRLTPIDAGFLHQEGANSHMHIGGVLVFDGEPPAFDELLDHIRGRLHLVPRYRQKLATPPLETGRPLWIDDPTFNLEFHVRHTALPAPGTEAQLLALVARIASQQLDRTKPLWELWMVEGLRGPKGRGPEQFAIICKTHHALVDGVAGVDLATVLFDLRPEPQASLSDLEPWVPHPRAVLSGAGRGERSRFGEHLAGAVAHGLVSAATPSRTVGRLRDAVEGVGEIVWAGLNPAPSTPLNVPIGPHRRYAVVRQRLADYRGDQERARRDRQRRRPGGRLRRARRLAAGSRHPHRGRRAAGARSGFRSNQRSPRHTRQQADGDARTAAGLHPGCDDPPRGRARRDGWAQGVQAGGGRRDVDRRRDARAAHRCSRRRPGSISRRGCSTCW